MKKFTLLHLSLLQRFVLMGALLGIVILACGAGYWWMYTGIGRFSGSVDALAEKISSHDQDRIRANHIGATLKQREQEIARIRGLSVSRTQPINFIEDLEAIGRATGSTVKVTANEAIDGADVLIFHIASDGSSSNFRRMVRLIELMPYKVAIDDVSYQSGGRESSGSGLLAVPGEGSSRATITVTLRVKTASFAP